MDHKDLKKQVDRIVTAICKGSSTQETSKVVTVCMIDDVNGNGTLLVPYVSLISIDLDTQVITPIGNFTSDYSSSYTPTNGVNAGAIGTTLGASQHRYTIDGIGSWNRPNPTTSVTVMVLAVGDNLNPPTVSDGGGTTTDLYQGTSESWSTVGSEQLTLTQDFTVTTNHAGDRVVILYTMLNS